MANDKKITDRALAATDNFSVFDDPVWEQRLDKLIIYTQRTEIITELTGTNVSTQRLKDVMDRRLRNMGIMVKRPRGKMQTPNAKQFLGKLPEKYDAALLMNLHFGTSGPGPHARAETKLGEALDRRLDVYARYCQTMFRNPSNPRIKFETYITLLNGIRSRSVSLYTCADCKSRYVLPQEQCSNSFCPVCKHMALDPKDAKKSLQRLLDAKRSNTKEVLRLVK